MRKSFIIISWILLLAGIQFCFAAGNAGLSFLKIGAGARASAMGEAFVGRSDDASGLFWNPAGVTALDNPQAHFTYNRWIQDIKHSSASAVWPTGKGAVGFTSILTTVEGIEKRVVASEEPIGEISAQDFTIGLGYSHRLTKRFSAAVHIKYLYEKLDVETAHGFAMDLGVIYALDVPGLKIGAVAQNFGKTLEMRRESIDLPKIIRFGASYEILDKQLCLNLDFVHIIDEKSHINSGVEYKLMDLLVLRCGYQSNYEEKSISAGFGFDVQVARLDYAYVPFQSDLGNSQRFTILFNF
jgi:hypothetical protein